MNNLILSGLLAIIPFVTTPSSAQTTGVPTTNDYTINGLGSGSTSAAFLTVSSGPVTFWVETEPGAPVVFLVSFVPAFPGFLGFPAQSCAPPMPFTAISATTNQSLDLNGNNPMIAFAGIPSADGVVSVTLTLSPGTFSTHAVAPHSCATGFPALFTQAFDVTVV